MYNFGDYESFLYANDYTFITLLYVNVQSEPRRAKATVNVILWACECCQMNSISSNWWILKAGFHKITTFLRIKFKSRTKKKKKTAYIHFFRPCIGHISSIRFISEFSLWDDWPVIGACCGTVMITSFSVSWNMRIVNKQLTFLCFIWN